MAAERPYRVAVVAACPFPWERGTPVRIRRMAEALSRRGHEVHVVAYHLGQDSDPLPFTVHRIPEIGWYHRTAPGPSYGKLAVVDRRLARTLRDVLEQHDIEVIHAHHYEGVLVTRWARRPDIPVVYDAHTTLESELPSYRLGVPSAVKRWFGAMLDRRLPRIGSHVIAVSDAIQERLVALGAVAAENVSVIPNGVRMDLFDGVTPGGNGAASHPAIVFAGNMAAYQGIDLMLQAFAQVLERRADASLNVITESSFGPYEAKARSLGVHDSINVLQSNFEQLPQHLAAGAVAVNPRVECAGLPQKLLNYMASGRPIVSFEGSAVMLANEQTALVVENGNTAAMADAIVRLLDDPELAGRLGAAARQLARDEYSWDATARRVERVYAKLLGS